MTVTPLAEKLAEAPLSKFVPVIVTFSLVPWLPELGPTAITVGAALTVNAADKLAALPSPLAIVTVRAPVVALGAIVIVAVSCVALTNVVEATVIPAPKDDASCAPLSKPVPWIVTLRLLAPSSPDPGEAEAIVGAGFTENTDPVAISPSGFVTLTVRAPIAAVEAIVMFAVSCVALRNVVELTVTPAPNDALAPCTKLVPSSETLKPVAPWSAAPGPAETIVGGATVTELLAPLIPDQERQTATTL